MFERSRSIQCSSVAMQLAGSKKVQEELGRPGVLEKLDSLFCVARVYKLLL